MAFALAAATKGLFKAGAVKEIVSFRPWIDTSLVGGIISNLLVVILFGEIYWQVDQDQDQTHFGFASALDAYYFSTITSSSVGYGDILPRTPKAKALTMVHVMATFFVMLPIIFKALEP